MNTYSILLHTHYIVVTLFLAQYVLKLWFLLLNKNEQLDQYSKTTRIPEMIVSVLFLVTGVWMMVAGAIVNTVLMIKLLCVFAAIPIAIIGFRKHNKLLGILAVLLIVSAFGLGEVYEKDKGKINTEVPAASSTNPAANDPLAVGKAFYSGSCKNCHGEDGKLGMGGAKDLTITQLTADQEKEIIRNGKSAMPAYPPEALNDQQLNDVILYIATLKK